MASEAGLVVSSGGVVLGLAGGKVAEGTEEFSRGIGPDIEEGGEISTVPCCTAVLRRICLSKGLHRLDYIYNCLVVAIIKQSCLYHKACV